MPRTLAVGQSAGTLKPAMLTIGAAARQTGLTAATLRKWEERYGFPVPLRTEGDHRVFGAADLDALVEISRRMAAGQRAGEAIRAVMQGQQIPPPKAQGFPGAYSPGVAEVLELLRKNDLRAFEGRLALYQRKHGAAAFANDLAIPMIEAVGELWQAGQLPVYAEHIFSGILHRVALQSVKDLTRVKISAPRVLLASPSAETHTLALVLMDAMLREAAIPAIWIQGSLPSAQIAQAAASFKVQVVALSASVAYPPKLLASELRTLRELLDASVQLWVGGAGTNRMSSQIDGITVMTSIDQAVRSLKKQGQTKPMRRSASQRNVP